MPETNLMKHVKRVEVIKLIYGMDNRKMNRIFLLLFLYNLSFSL